MKLPENFKIPQTTWFCNTAIPQLKINISAKLHHPKPLRTPSWTSLLLKSSLLKSTGKVLAQEQPLQKRQGMQTSVVVILFVCLFFNWLSIFFPLLYFYWCVFTGIYLFFCFCFVLFCFCSLKPLTTADNVQIIHLHKSIQFTLTLSRNYWKQRSQKLNNSTPFPFQEQRCCGHR